ADREAGGGAGLAAADPVARPAQPVTPAARDSVVAGPLARALGAQCLDRRDRTQAVFGLEVAVDLGDALGERAQERRAMRHGLVAGHVGRAGQTGCRTHAEPHRRPSRTPLIPPSAACSPTLVPPA